MGLIKRDTRRFDYISCGDLTYVTSRLSPSATLNPKMPRGGQGMSYKYIRICMCVFYWLDVFYQSPILIVWFLK